MKLVKRIVKWTVAVILLVLVGWLFIAYWTSTNDCNRNAATPTNPMKAIFSCEYGVENLQLQEIEKPTPKDNEVLVRVRATSINPVDGHLIRGAWLMRPMSGMRKPKNTRFGTDFAGVVEAVGKDVSNFKPGDEVFGAKNGAVAGYICVNADRAVVMKPANVTFEQAGSVAVAGLTALQGLRDKGHIQAGQKVLINGAWGGVGRNFWNAFLSNFNKQKFVFYIAKLTKDDLNVLRDLMQSGKVAPVIDRTYKMSETQAALRYLEEGHAHGKVVITLE